MICSSVNRLFLVIPPVSEESENTWISFRVSSQALNSNVFQERHFGSERTRYRPRTPCSFRPVRQGGDIHVNQPRD